MSTLADRLAKAMGGRKQVALAKACGVSPPSVNLWLSGGSKRMDGAHLIKACDFLGVRPRWLALGEGPMTDWDSGPETLADLPDLVAWIKKKRPDLL
jgi:hypothetical protein